MSRERAVTALIVNSQRHGRNGALHSLQYYTATLADAVALSKTNTISTFFVRGNKSTGKQRTGMKGISPASTFLDLFLHNLKSKEDILHQNMVLLTSGILYNALKAAQTDVQDSPALL